MVTIVEKSNILSWSMEHVATAPRKSGVYVLRNLPSDLSGIIYIGHSVDLRERLEGHWLSSDVPEVSWFDWYVTDTPEAARTLEKDWISKYSPKYNQRIG